MSTSLVDIRAQKHQAANGGIYPLASEKITDIATVNNIFADDKSIVVSLDPKDLAETHYKCISGRIVAFRKSGALSFIKVRDHSGFLQIIAKRDVTSGYENLSKFFDLGDIIQAEGYLCLSKTNENSVLAKELVLLTKAQLPPPEKFSGISNTEVMYRQRYIDLLSSDTSRAVAVVKALTLRSIRKYLDDRNFIEVETSTLNNISSGANAKPFVTHHNTLESDMFLRIAPELYLKRLVVGGLERVYEIGRCYRNEGVSSRHNPEFTMLEFYQAYGRFENLLAHVKDMLQFVDTEVDRLVPSMYLPCWKQWKEARTFSFEKFAIVPMEQAVLSALDKCGLSPNIDFSSFRVECVTERMKNLEVDLAKELANCNTRGQRVAACFEYLAEPFLCEDYRTEDESRSIPVLVTEYPTDICPLARQNDNNPQVCDRFELFVNGRELANAFQELNDPQEQELRFKAQLSTNEKDPMTYDADYIQALQYGLPPTIGFGMGIDRLIMLLTNAASIKDVILFPTMKVQKEV